MKSKLRESNPIIRDFSRRHFEPVMSWEIDSKTRKDVRYQIDLWADGQLTCSCCAGLYRHNCSHLIEKRSELISFYGGIQEAIIHFREQKNGVGK